MGSFWKKIIRPLAFAFDPETVHELGIEAMRLGVAGRFASDFTNEFGPIERFRLSFRNPLGVAAGFDKNGRVVDQLASLGFGFVEVGTVTLEAQPGNEKPRLFRLPDDQALINRLGFNNQGSARIAERLSNLERRSVVGVNIGKNKNVSNDNAVENYLKCFDAIRGVADYVAINISSPNTPNLRELQKGDHLEHLLAALQQRNSEGVARPLLVKIAPDLSQGEIESMVESCIKHRVSGVIATNTTISREGLRTNNLDRLGGGGLSGKPLTKRSTAVISEIFRLSRGKLPIVGVGGIFNAADAFEKIAAGACLLQAYTGFIYTGPSFAVEINGGLAGILRERGFSKLDEAVGSAVKQGGFLV
jgi:dihydroorotate dehydrogenase